MVLPPPRSGRLWAATLRAGGRAWAARGPRCGPHPGRVRTLGPAPLGDFIKRVTQMSWPWFVYILRNCYGKGGKKTCPLRYAVKYRTLRFRGADGAKEGGPEDWGVSNSSEKRVSITHPHPNAHTRTLRCTRTPDSGNLLCASCVDAQPAGTGRWPAWVLELASRLLQPSPGSSTSILPNQRGQEPWSSTRDPPRVCAPLSLSSQCPWLQTHLLRARPAPPTSFPGVRRKGP